jgi:ABC-type iron transport system FetAB ATPase subunit
MAVKFMSRLKIESLYYHNFGPISLTLSPSECVCISGPSGSGKTLLLRAIADMDPHEGEVYLDNSGCRQMTAPDWRRQVAMLPAESQWWATSVSDHFPENSLHSLEKLGFTEEVMDWEISRLSTGERQRLALVRLLRRRPRVLLLDEPTANLDAENTKRAEGVIREYVRNSSASVLWVSHDREQIRRVANRWFRILDGALIEEAVT